MVNCCWAVVRTRANGRWSTASTSRANSRADTVVREIKEETGIDAIVTDLVAVTSSNKVLTTPMATTPCTWIISFLCALKPGGNAEPFVGDEESLSVGWFDLDDLPTPLAASTSERLELFHTLHREQKHGDAHALFQFDGQQYYGYKS